ncbi:hypothetical protein Q8A73_007208 [Channa argus]|nr:hypothetical protein Q8A73_007208 [Channa argus]
MLRVRGRKKNPSLALRSLRSSVVLVTPNFRENHGGRRNALMAEMQKSVSAPAAASRRRVLQARPPTVAITERTEMAESPSCSLGAVRHEQRGQRRARKSPTKAGAARR